MRRSLLPLTLAALTVLFSGRAASAGTAPFTVFVDAQRGTDGSNCGSIGSPCKTFQHAVDRVAPGGKVIAEESGEYGAITITKAVTVEAAAGVAALIVTASGKAIDINAGSADTVTLRNLTLVSQPSIQASIMGIRFVSGYSLRVEKCVIDGYSFGIYANTTTSALLTVSDTTFRSCHIGGVSFGSTSAATRGAFDRCLFEDNQSGLLLQVNGIGVVRDSTFTGMPGVAVIASVGPTGTQAELNLERCLIAHNEIGVSSSGLNGGAATVRISNCTITDNNSGVYSYQGGVMLSRSNNTIEGNVNDVVGTLGTYSPK